MLLPTGVTLSRNEGSIAMGAEMFRCAQYDSAVLLIPPIDLLSMDVPIS